MGRVLTSLVAVVLAAGSVTAGVYTPHVRGIVPLAKGGKGCAERLGNNVYRCTVAQEGGSTFTDCLHFSSPGAVSDKFDLLTDQLGATLGCTCKAKGKPSKPKFDASSEFECTGDEEVAFEGTVSRSGKKIGRGFASNAAGTGFVFTCTLDAACAP
jgi:hypothetical protein